MKKIIALSIVMSFVTVANAQDSWVKYSTQIFRNFNAIGDCQQMTSDLGENGIVYDSFVRTRANYKNLCIEIYKSGETDSARQSNLRIELRKIGDSRVSVVGKYIGKNTFPLWSSGHNEIYAVNLSSLDPYFGGAPVPQRDIGPSGEEEFELLISDVLHQSSPVKILWK